MQGPDAPTITLLEARSLLGSSGDTGLRTWEAALRLGSFLCSNEGRNLIDGKDILELGAGSGFLSILCAKYLNARSVLATDGSGGVVDELKSNIYLIGLEDGRLIDGAFLKWGDVLADGALCSREHLYTYDLILGSDIVSLI